MAIALVRGDVDRAVSQHASTTCSSHAGDLDRHRDVARTTAEQRPAGTPRKLTQVEQGHHRQPVADERVVRVVPLRALGVHPDAPAGHEVGELGERGDEQLLEQRHDDELAVGAEDELAVRAQRGDALARLGACASSSNSIVALGSRTRSS